MLPQSSGDLPCLLQILDVHDDLADLLRHVQQQLRGLQGHVDQPLVDRHQFWLEDAHDGEVVGLEGTSQRLGHHRHIAAHQARLFDPYFTTKPEGTGLGLTIARSIAQQHEGELQIESDVGVGTRASVTLPRHVRKVDGVET